MTELTAKEVLAALTLLQRGLNSELPRWKGKKYLASKDPFNNEAVLGWLDDFYSEVSIATAVVEGAYSQNRVRALKLLYEQMGPATLRYKGIAIDNTLRFPHKYLERLTSAIDGAYDLLKTRGVERVLFNRISVIRLTIAPDPAAYMPEGRELFVSCILLTEVPHATIVRTLIHEMAHILHEDDLPRQAKRFWDSAWDDGADIEALGIPTAYGRTSLEEDFAETFATYVTAPSKLSETARYRLLRTLSLAGLYGKPVAKFARRDYVKEC